MDMIYTSEVLKSDIDDVISKILKFEKRLKSAINYTISESFWVYDKDYGMLEKVTIDADIPDIEYVKPGYKVVAIINYSNMFDNKSIITLIDKNFKDEVEKYRDIKDAKCDHCNVDRYRKAIYLIYNQEKNEIKVVGSTCLKDFLKINIDPYSIFTKCEKFFDKITDDFKINNRIKLEHRFFNIDYILAIGMLVSGKTGYISKSKAIAMDNVDLATSNLVFKYLFIDEKNSVGETIKKQEITEELKNTGKILYDWILQNQNTVLKDSEFDNNLRIIINSKKINFKSFGFALYIIELFNKTHEFKVSANNEISSFYGNINDKITVDVTLQKIQRYNNNFGISNILTFEDNESRVFIWFTSTSIGNLCIGQKYKMLGKVKKHNVFNNIKQNIMTHCKIIDI